MTRRLRIVAAVLCAGAIAAPMTAAAVAPPFEADDFHGDRVVLGTDGAVWFGSVEGVLTQIDPDTGAERRIDVGEFGFTDLAPGIGGDAIWAGRFEGIVRVTPLGTTTTVALPPEVVAWSMHPGADGRMWFLGGRGGRDDPGQELPEPVLGTVSAVGVVEIHDLPGLPDGATVSSALGRAPDGSLWATMPFAERVARIEPDGSFVTFDVGDNPVGEPIAAPDGRMWVVVDGQIARLSLDGSVAGRITPPLDVTGTGLGDVSIGMTAFADAVWVTAGGGVVRVSGDGRRVIAIRDADFETDADQVVAADERLWFDGGRLDLSRAFAEVRMRAVQDASGIRLTAEVVADHRQPTGLVAFDAISTFSHHGYPNIREVGTAQLVDGRASVVLPPPPPGAPETLYRARYQGDATWAPNTSDVTATASRWGGFVHGAYRGLLNREGDPGGVAHWTAVLDATGDPRRFTGELTGSVEWRRLAVEASFEQLLARQADTGGRDFFVGVLGRGRRLAEVRASLAASPEYVARNGNGDDAVWVDALFRDLLGRAPDDSGRSYLLGLRARGVDRALVAGGVAASPEAFGRTVDAAFGLLLGRAPDAGGRAFWIDRLRAGAVEATLLADIAASGEFQARAAR